PWKMPLLPLRSVPCTAKERPSGANCADLTNPILKGCDSLTTWPVSRENMARTLLAPPGPDNETQARNLPSDDQEGLYPTTRLTGSGVRSFPAAQSTEATSTLLLFPVFPK